MVRNLYVDIHVLQTVPPSCVNRDDAGTPKMAFYGGVPRSRVSSQSWKHAMRLMLEDEANASLLVGARTLKAAEMVAERIADLDPSVKDPKKLAKESLTLAGLFGASKDDANENAGSDAAADGGKGNAKEKEEKMETGALFFISEAQADSIARLGIRDKDLSMKKKDTKKLRDEYKTALQKLPSVDIAMFGRMVAGNTPLNYDACMQVAHSISTHAVQNEYDYYTALDDRAGDTPGAGFIGTTEFNSATMYRYATINVRELAENLGGTFQVPAAIRAFAMAFIRSMPTGKQNSFANRTVPDIIYMTVRGDQPVNLSGAFEMPITAGDQGYVARSREALQQYAEEVYAYYADEPLEAFVIGRGMETLGTPMKIDPALDALEAAVAKYQN